MTLQRISYSIQGCIQKCRKDNNIQYMQLVQKCPCTPMLSFIPLTVYFFLFLNDNMNIHKVIIRTFWEKSHVKYVINKTFEPFESSHWQSICFQHWNRSLLIAFIYGIVVLSPVGRCMRLGVFLALTHFNSLPYCQLLVKSGGIKQGKQEKNPTSWLRWRMTAI